jgi:hypothetical protein
MQIISLEEYRLFAFFKSHKVRRLLALKYYGGIYSLTTLLVEPLEESCMHLSRAISVPRQFRPAHTNLTTLSHASAGTSPGKRPASAHDYVRALLSPIRDKSG